MKKAFCVLYSFVLLITQSIVVYASSSNELIPMYDNIASIGTGLTINTNTGVALCSGEVDSYYEVPVEVLVQLQVYKNNAWKTLMSWSDTGTGYAYIDRYYTVDEGYEYKVKVTGYICNDLGIPIESEVAEKTVYYPAS